MLKSNAMPNMAQRLDNQITTSELTKSRAPHGLGVRAEEASVLRASRPTCRSML